MGLHMTQPFIGADQTRLQGSINDGQFPCNWLVAAHQDQKSLVDFELKMVPEDGQIWRLFVSLATPRA